MTIASTAAGQAALDAKVLGEMTARYAEGDDADPATASLALAALAARMQAVVLARASRPATAWRLVRRLGAELRCRW